MSKTNKNTEPFIQVNPPTPQYAEGDKIAREMVSARLSIPQANPLWQKIMDMTPDWTYYISPRVQLPDTTVSIQIVLKTAIEKSIQTLDFLNLPVSAYFYGYKTQKPSLFLVWSDQQVDFPTDKGTTILVTYTVNMKGILNYSGMVDTKAFLMKQPREKVPKIEVVKPPPAPTPTVPTEIIPKGGIAVGEVAPEEKPPEEKPPEVIVPEVKPPIVTPPPYEYVPTPQVAAERPSVVTLPTAVVIAPITEEPIRVPRKTGKTFFTALIETIDKQTEQLTAINENLSEINSALAGLRTDLAEAVKQIVEKGFKMRTV